MFRSPSVVLLSVIVPLAAVVAPVATLPRAEARPVTPTVRSVPLTAPEGWSPGRFARVGSGAASQRAWAELPVAARGAPPGPPERFVSRQAVAPFQMLGVTWAAGSAADITVLARSHGRRGWSRWTALEVSPTPRAREARSGRLGTEPLWVGTSDGYQIRVDVRRGALPRGLRVHLIDPGSSPADSGVGTSRTVSSAAASTGQPQIFTRSQWGADESLRDSAPRYNATIKAGFVHHTAGTNGYSETDVPKIIRGIYAYHVKGNGWSDIGYNFLVDRFGRMWEGRYGGMARPVVGAHTGGFNDDSFAVSAIGDYSNAPAPEPMTDSIARLLAWKLSLHHRDPAGTTVLTSEGGPTARTPAGTKVTVNVISGHRDVGRTACPGNNVYSQLGAIRTLTSKYLGTALLSPRVTPPSVIYGSGEFITTTAKVTSEQTWRMEIRQSCGGSVVRSLTGSATPDTPLVAAWDLRDETGTPVRPGAYTLTLVSFNSAGNSRPWSGTVTVHAPRTVPPRQPAAPLPGLAGFVPVDPVKIYDSRSAGTLPLGPRGRVDLQIPGAGPLPENGVSAVALSVTASCASAATALTAWPAGRTMPSAPTLTVPAGSTTSTLAVTPVGGNGMVSVGGSTATTELSVHVVGYYPSTGGQGFRPMRPLRLYDSRRDPAGTVAAGTSRVIDVPALGRVPATSITGVLLNVTATGASGSGSLTVASPDFDRKPTTVAFAGVGPVKTRAVARLENGRFKLTASGSATDVSVDVTGFWSAPPAAAPRFQARAATRVLDTRSGLGAPAARIDQGGVVSLKVAGRGKLVPLAARAAVLNVSAVDASRPTFVTAWPRGSARPALPDLSVPPARTTSNLVVVPVGTNGRVQLTNGSGSVHLVADLVGFYR